MRLKALIACLALLDFGSSLSSQSISSAPVTPNAASTRTDAINAANDATAQQAAAQSKLMNDAAQARYVQDMAEFRETLRAEHRTAVADQQLYDHQQRAYADAMTAWRKLVADCNDGKQSACNASTPDPANFW